MRATAWAMGTPADFVVLITDHVAEFLFGDQLHGANSKPGAEDSVECGGVTTPLQVTQDNVTALLSGSLLHFVRQVVPNAAQADLSRSPGGILEDGDFSLHGVSPFRHHNHGGRKPRP